MFIDLHTHTTCSDGTMTPEAVVLYAQRKDLKAVAITDHDTVAGNNLALRTGESVNTEVIPGVELSAQCERGSTHILGLYIDSCNEEIKKATTFLQKKRRERNIEIVAKLKRMGVEIKENIFLQNAYLGRPHIAQKLVEAGYCTTIDQAFDTYLKRGAAAYQVREKLSLERTVHTVLKAGGIPILAHPVTVSALQQTLEQLIHAGLQGIEAYYPTHSTAEIEYFKDIAQKHDLVITGGSDFHGEHKPDIDLGCMKVPADLLDALKAKLRD